MTAFLALSLLLPLFPSEATLPGNPCADGTHADPTAVAVICKQRIHGQTPGQVPWIGSAPIIEKHGPVYRYLWLPNCPGALPREDTAGELDCVGAHDCADASLMAMSLWATLDSAAGASTRTAGWHYLRSECRDPSDAGPVQPQQQRRTLTWQNVLSAVRRVGVPGGTVHAPRFTLVNLETTFWTDPQPVDRSITVIGFDVDVQITPSSYTWHWGDGTTDTTETPGRPFPATDVTHTYVHATDEGPPLEVSVDVTYSARYRVNGGEWQAIPETITIPGAPTSLPVKQAAAVLMSSD